MELGLAPFSVLVHVTQMGHLKSGSDAMAKLSGDEGCAASFRSNPGTLRRLRDRSRSLAMEPRAFCWRCTCDARSLTREFGEWEKVRCAILACDVGKAGRAGMGKTRRDLAPAAIRRRPGRCPYRSRRRPRSRARRMPNPTQQIVSNEENRK